jgi:SNF family Na+-dependent transporter
LAVFIVYLCIRNGIKDSGKISVITATTPFLFLFIMLIRGFFLEGSMDGIKYLFKPSFSNIFSLDMWKDAAV